MQMLQIKNDGQLENVIFQNENALGNVMFSLRNIDTFLEDGNRNM